MTLDEFYVWLRDLFGGMFQAALRDGDPPDPRTVAALERALPLPVMAETSAGPPPTAHGWYARGHDGFVSEVWVFGSGPWVGVDREGRVVMSGSGDVPHTWLSATKAEAIERVLEDADRDLTRARAVVDKLRAELVSE